MIQDTDVETERNKYKETIKNLKKELEDLYQSNIPKFKTLQTAVKGKYDKKHDSYTEWYTKQLEKMINGSFAQTNMEKMKEKSIIISHTARQFRNDLLYLVNEYKMGAEIKMFFDKFINKIEEFITVSETFIKFLNKKLEIKPGKGGKKKLKKLKTIYGRARTQSRRSRRLRRPLRRPSRRS